MSAFIRYLNKPSSIFKDAYVALASGIISGALVNIVFDGWTAYGMEFGQMLAFSIGGLITGAVYQRARQNVNSPAATYE